MRGITPIGKVLDTCRDLWESDMPGEGLSGFSNLINERFDPLKNFNLCVSGN
jgi:hypothetical protein